MKFDEYFISNDVKRAISELGYKRPTDIQYKSIPATLGGEDVMAVAQTGTGKTAAFAIPVIHILHERKKNARRVDGIQCIVLEPTHELVLQTYEVFEQLSKYTLVRTTAIYGGVDQDPQIDELNRGTDLIIATPGRMFDLISQGHLLIHRVNILILDEADHMLDLGFIGDIRDLTRKLSRSRQTLFYSATINPGIKKLAYSLIDQNAIRIQISPKDPVSKNVDHSVGFIEMDEKRFFLERLINEHPESKILVFVRTKVRAERVSKAMDRVGISTLVLHSDKDDEDRVDILQQFKDGEELVMISTDVAARGIDVPDIAYVVNYDLPDKAENYVHRVGRTGRGKKRGLAFSFCSKDERGMLEEIEAFMGKSIPRIEITKSDHEETILFANEKENDWEKLLKDSEELEASHKRKKKKKK